MKKVKITIVDSGVRKSHPAFREDEIKGFTWLGDGRTREEFDDTFGHGTAIYGIIRKTLDYADITNIRVPQIEDGVDEEVLSSLLHYIAENVETDLLNLSLGVCICDDLKRLREACLHLDQKNILVISAFDNAGAISYPAAFPEVIGVTSGSSCRRFRDFEYHPDDMVNLAAKGTVQKLAWLSPDYILLEGNSFACAHAAVQAAEWLAGGYCGRKEILEQFREASVVQNKAYVSARPVQTLFPITNAALFPFCKEMHSLLRFHDLLTFRIADVYDIKYSAVVGADVRLLMKDESAPALVVKNIEHIEWDAFDTLIIGHMGELSSLTGRKELYRNLLKEAKEHQKQIVAFDDLTGILEDEVSVPVYFPKVDRSNLPASRYGKLYRISKPVVGVFGTSSRQGKFTLQLILRRSLLRKGYRIGQIGTEPSALLFGMDDVYPMGYNCSVYLRGLEAVQYLNSRMNALCEKDVDLILAGSQSGTVPYDVGNLVQYPCMQYDFLMGTLPDAVILCINGYDEPEYVGRTIRFLESAVECRVIAAVLYPLDFRDESRGIHSGRAVIPGEKEKALKERMREQFGIPLYLLGKEDEMEELTGQIIQYFEE